MSMAAEISSDSASADALGRERVVSYGVLVDYGDADPSSRQRRRCTCSACGHGWYAIPRFGKSKAGWNPPCPVCVHSRPGVGFKHEQLFPRGTKALYHTRDTQQRHKVAIECRGCFAETGERKFVFHLTLRRYTSGLILILALVRWQESGDAFLWSAVYRAAGLVCFWDELCPDCRAARGSLLKVAADY